MGEVCGRSWLFEVRRSAASRIRGGSRHAERCWSQHASAAKSRPRPSWPVVPRRRRLGVAVLHPPAASRRAAASSLVSGRPRHRADGAAALPCRPRPVRRRSRAWPVARDHLPPRRRSRRRGAGTASSGKNRRGGRARVPRRRAGTSAGTTASCAAARTTPSSSAARAASSTASATRFPSTTRRCGFGCRPSPPRAATR